MKWLRYISLSFLILICAVLSIAAHYYYKGFYGYKNVEFKSETFAGEPEAARIKEKAESLKKFASNKGYNQKFIFLADMSMPSGRNRFFVYDLSKDSVILSSLVAHGAGKKFFSLLPVFSNQKESGCTSLGRYKIGESYAGRFGRAYKLYGLDSSNSNAFSRNIVLHSYYCVPEKETFPYPICNSLGCAMVSPAFLKQLQLIIDKNTKSILLWIFD
jgi:hypothetical protein